MKEILSKLNAYYHSMLELLPRIGLSLIFLVVGILIAGWLTAFIGKRINSKAHDKLMVGFLTKSVKLILIIIVFLIALSVAGLSGISAALLATAGASAVVIGFAFKDIAQNFLAGIILAFNRPFNVGDTVQIENVFGKVITMEFRYTKIDTFDGRSVYIPNSDVLTKPVFNYTEDGFFRTDFLIGIAYEDDIDKAKKLIQECLDEHAELVHDEKHINFLVEDELAASTVNLKVYIWISTDDFRRGMLETRGRVITKTKKIMETNGFNLPSDITEVKFYDASKPLKVQNEKSFEESKSAALEKINK